jgi:hypothetical protein
MTLLDKWSVQRKGAACCYAYPSAAVKRTDRFFWDGYSWCMSVRLVRKLR